MASVPESDCQANEKYLEAQSRQILSKKNYILYILIKLYAFIHLYS